MKRALDVVARKLGSFSAQLRREDLGPLDRGIVLLQRALAGAGLAPHLDVRRHRVLELGQAPTILRGLRDLEIRGATLEDARGIAAVKGTEVAPIEDRLRRGDLGFIGLLQGRVLCHVFFHAGPEPFHEDARTMGAWCIEAGTFWSYDAATTQDSMASGIFVKVFQTALAELFTARGAARVLCRIDVAHGPSIALHERLGFCSLGELLTLATPAGNLVSWGGTHPQRKFGRSAAISF